MIKVKEMYEQSKKLINTHKNILIQYPDTAKRIISYNLLFNKNDSNEIFTDSKKISQYEYIYADEYESFFHEKEFSDLSNFLDDFNDKYNLDEMVNKYVPMSLIDDAYNYILNIFNGFHGGDCTGFPFTCMICYYSEWFGLKSDIWDSKSSGQDVHKYYVSF